MKSMMWWSLALLGGCDLVEGVRDAAEGVTNRNVAIGLVVRAEASGEDLAALEEQEAYASGLSATLFLADASQVNNLDDAPVRGAKVMLSGCEESVTLSESPAGTYRRDPGTALDACTSDRYLLERVDVEEGTAAPVSLPPAPTVQVPETWQAGEPMTLDLSDQGFGSALVTVIDVGAGRVTFSNEPEGVMETYRFLTASEEVGEVQIPGAAFGEDTVHAVVITGLLRTPNADLTQANTALSVVVGGRARPYPVTTLEVPDLDTGALDTDTDAQDTDAQDTDGSDPS